MIEETIECKINIENIEEFVKELLENNYSTDNTFAIICLFKDKCMKDVNYLPQVNDDGIKIKHEWELVDNEIDDWITLNVKDFRKILMDDLELVFDKVGNKYKTKLQEFNDFKRGPSSLGKKYESCINLSSELSVQLSSSGKLFKEFIDCYRLGYFDD
jgi:hypothetical protein